MALAVIPVVFVATLLLAAGGAPGTAFAQSSDANQGDQDGSGTLCRAGAVPDYDNVQSLERVFGEVARGVGGQIIRAELKQRGFNNLCVWVYEVKTLSDAGKVTMAVFDASDLRLIGFSTPSSLDIGPVVQLPQSDPTRKSLQEPDGDGRADSDAGIEAAAGESDGFSEADATDSSADTTDDGQRGGAPGGKNDSGSTDGSGSSATDGSSPGTDPADATGPDANAASSDSSTAAAQ